MSSEKTVNSFVVSSELLKPVLTKMGKVIPSNPTIPALSNIYCKVTPGQLEMICTDTEITMYFRVLVESKESFEVLIPFGFLSKIIQLNKQCPLTFTVGEKVKILGDTDAYEVKSPDKVADYPKLQPLPKKSTVDITDEILLTMNTALASTAKVAENAKLSHVLLELAPGKITVASSDGAYLVYSKEFKSEQQEKEELLISPKVIAALSGCVFPKLYFHKKAIGFETPELTVVATRSEDKFVNFRAVFPADWEGNLNISRSRLLEALGKCLLSSDPMHRTKIDLTRKGGIILSADDNMVSINVEVPAAYEGNVQETFINAEKLQRLLHQVASEDDVVLAVHDARKAIVVTSPEDEGYKGLIMPIANFQ